MNLFKVEIPQSKLTLIPEDERIFFVQLGNLLNDFSILQKLTYFSANTETTNKIVRGAQNSQALFLIRIHAGILWEGWQFLQKDFFGTKISKEYEKELSDLERSSLRELKKYFKRKNNLIGLIRNRFAFHYSSEDVQKQMSEAPDSEVFEIFMGDTHGNCFYSISHILVVFAILKSTGCSDIDEATKKWLRDMLQVTRWFADFLGGCLVVIGKKYLGFKHGEVEIPEPPHVDDVTLPYFVKGEPK